MRSGKITENEENVRIIATLLIFRLVAVKTIDSKSGR